MTRVQTRRDFLKTTALAATTTVRAAQVAQPAPDIGPAQAPAALPWYRRTLRWGQTNITEIDPAGYDIGWWRQHWKRTRVQGVILNAGGIVAYYPSRFEWHHRALALGARAVRSSNAPNCGSTVRRETK